MPQSRWHVLGAKSDIYSIKCACVQINMNKLQKPRSRHRYGNLHIKNKKNTSWINENNLLLQKASQFTVNFIFSRYLTLQVVYISKVCLHSNSSQMNWGCRLKQNKFIMINTQNLWKIYSYVKYSTCNEKHYYYKVIIIILSFIL